MKRSDLPPALTREQERSRRKHEVRARTENLRRLPKRERRVLALLVPALTSEEEALRPRTRGDCADGIRPCPWVACRHHLYLDVTREGSLKLNFPDLEPDQLAETCSLDVADFQGESLEAVGELCNVTRERIRQLENRALERLPRRMGRELLDAAREGFARPKGDPA